MDKLRLYLNSITPSEQVAFAKRCGTSVNYMRKAISLGQRFDAGLVVNIERETRGLVTCEHLRPDVDWPVVRCQESPAAAVTA